VRPLRLTAILALALLPAHAATSVPTEFPFQFREGLLWISASLPNSAEPLNLLLDTGAGVSVINETTAERLKLNFGRPVTVHGVGTTLTGYWLKPLSATANGVALPANFLAVDLARLSKSCAQPVDGLLGADFFRGRVVQIDFEALKIRILPPRTALIPNAAPLQFRTCGMRIQVSVDGRKAQWVRLDTGCVSALQWVTSDVRSQDCMRKPAIGLTELSIPQTETTVQLGSSRFQNVPTGIHAQPIFQGEAGLLGNGLLSRFSSITIDAKGGHLVLQPPHPKPE
jgi:hypothetical protein